MSEADTMSTPVGAAAKLHLDRGDAGPALLAAMRRSEVVWANPAALRLFAARDVQELGDVLFRTGPAARSFASRLAGIGPQPRLERLQVVRGWPPMTASCVAVAAADEPLALIRIEAAVPRALVPPPDPSPPEAAARPAPARPGRPIRVLWEADRDGIVTHVGRQADGVAGLDVFTVGEPATARLRTQSPDLADRLDRARRDQGAVASTRLEWPRPRGAAPLRLDIGCTARAGLGGLRGFLLVHAPLRPDAAPPVEAVPPETAAASESGSSAPAASAALADGAVGGGPDAPPAAPTADDTDMPPPRTPAPADAPTSGNVVHFPAMRLASVPAKFTEEMRPAPAAAPAPAEADIPRWSESPDDAAAGLPDGLTADERDAFDHIAKVLGTRPSPGGPASDAPSPAAPPEAAEPRLSDAASDLFAALPVALLLRRGGGTEVNPAFLAQAGDASADAFRTRLRGADPTAPGALTRTDGTTLAGEPYDLEIAGRPARLLLLPEAAAPRHAPPIVGETLSLPVDVLESVSGGFVEVGATGTIVAASPKAAATFGSTPPDLVGRRMTDVIAAEADVDWRAGRRTHLAGRTRTGDAVPLAAEIVPFGQGALCILDAGRPVDAGADETGAALRAAERASALKSEFLAKVSHEIRTPLNAILGFAEVIRDERLGPVGNSRYLDYLRDIHASGTHVMSLVNDLLDLSRIEAGRMDLRLEAVDANAVVQSCVNTLQTQAHRGRIIMRLSLAPTLPPALADERSLRQIVLNLLSNAVKFNEPGGQVIVSTAPVGAEAVAIRIRDTGIGMTEEEVVAAMEPFRQLSTVNRTGSGLGLPLTKALVEANCASMAIKSSRGEGTLVEVTFPMVEPNAVSLPA